MPYGKRRSGKKVLVVNTETGRVLGAHPSEADANRQLAALHMHKAHGAKPVRKRK